MVEWFSDFGFRMNPLTVSPFSKRFKLIDRTFELSEIVYRIKSSNMLFVEGDSGSGKTALLAEVIKRFKGRIIYVDCGSLAKDLNIESLLVNKHGFVRGRILGLKPKRMILMLDNVSQLSNKNSERIKYFFDNDYLGAVIFTGDDIRSVDFSESLRQRIGKRIIRLKPLSFEQVCSFIDDVFPEERRFKRSFIKNVYEHSDKCFGDFLKNLDLLLQHALDSGSDVHGMDSADISKSLHALLKNSSKPAKPAKPIVESGSAAKSDGGSNA